MSISKITKRSVPVGSKWLDTRDITRSVVVVEHDKITGKVVIDCNGRKTKANLERFNGKQGGYKRVETL